MCSFNCQTCRSKYHFTLNNILVSYFRIELTLSKQSNETWQGVVIGDARGEMTLDPVVVEEIHQRLAGLTSSELVGLLSGNSIL